MIFVSFLFFALTMLVIFYPLVRTQSAEQEVTLQGIYQKNYVTAEHRLANALKNGTLTQAEYDSQNAEAARELLKMSKKNSTNLSKPARLLVVLIALMFPLLAVGGFWAYSYTPETRTYDAERSRLITEFTEWREILPASELDSFNNILTVEPQPRNPEIFNELKYGFPALFFMSAKDTHDNIPTLKLLGKLVYDVKWFPAAHEVYSRILTLSPNDFIANAMIIDIELQNSNNKLTPALTAKMERFFALFPQETSMRVMYAQTLYDNQMIDQSIAQWQILRNLFAQNTDPERQAQKEQTLQAIDIILASIAQRTLETAQVRNFEIDISANLDWNVLSSPALLTLYMVDQEDNSSLAYKEILITQDNPLPKQVALNDYDRFQDIDQPIRNYEHLAVFGEITNLATAESLYITDMVELPKGAYESALTFIKNDSSVIMPELMASTLKSSKAQDNQRFLVQVNVPNVDLSTLPEDATLNIFISQAGSRMPLAAKKITSAKNLTFPLTVEITDDNRIMQGSPSLFSMENLEVGGRLSMTSEVIGTTGDIESAKQAITPEKANILILDQVRDTSRASPIAPRL